MPFRPIVNETRTWQFVLGEFLQISLNKLNLNDPYRVSNSEAVVSILQKYHNSDVNFCSFDAVDMFYNLDHEILIESITDAIEEYGAINFQNDSHISINDFLRLISVYLKSSIIEIENEVDNKTKKIYYKQKSGVCIGSKIASNLSDLFTAKINKKIEKILKVKN